MPRGALAFVLLIALLALLAFGARKIDALAASVASGAIPSLGAPETLEQLPEEWIEILILVEDPSFYEHRGIDLRTPGQGWTTITQGLVKRHFPGPLAGAWGKTRQSLFAIALDRHLSKQQQLQLFLETAYFGTHDGRELLGFESAARSLFARPLVDLSRGEWVDLVAMLVGPNTFHPLDRASLHADRVARIEALIARRCEPLSWRDVYLEGCDRGE